ncbi:MAG: substrate-binding domain-containing protein, partial [Acidobacteriota bacterium]|nr:substrate-binding domain-containing protein [Acidobacteriota bacterium]
MSDLVQSVQRACQLLQAFRSEGEVLRLRDLVIRTSLHKATASRLLRTLETEGLVERLGGDRFRSCVRVPLKRRYRIGFATRGSDTAFSRSVTESVQRAAEEAGMNMITISSRRSARMALQNAATLVRENVDLVIEFQSHERVAPTISSLFLAAGIPVIAIEIPHPGATFFGANNYQAGLLGGRAAARWVKQHWNGEAGSVLLIGEELAGPLVKLRVSGMLAGLRELLPALERVPTVEVDARGSLDRTMEKLRQHLRHAPARRTVVLAGNDPMALGAVRTFEECGRAGQCCVMGQNATVEARMELRRKSTSLIGSIAYFPERYGDEVIRLASSVLVGQHVPPAVFTPHQLITRENVDRVYPLDQVIPESLTVPLSR